MAVDVDKAAVDAAVESIFPETDAAPSPEQTAPEPEPDPRELAAKAWEKVEQLEKRLVDTQAWAQQNAALAQHTQQTLAQYEAQRQYEQQRYAQAQRLPPPKYPEPEEYINRPEAIQEAIQATGGWVYANLLAQLGPVAQRQAFYEQQMGPVLQLAARQAAGEARAALASRGVSEDTFDELWPEVWNSLQATPALLANPQSVAQATLAIGFQRGKKFNAEATGDMPMPSIGVGGNGAGSGKRPGKPSTSPYVREIEERLGVKLNENSKKELAAAVGRHR